MIPERGAITLIEEWRNPEIYRLWKYADGGLVLETNGEPAWEDDEGFWDLLEELRAS